MNQWPFYSEKCRKDVDRVLRSGRLTSYRANAEWGVGPQKWSEAYAFEREIEKKFKVKQAVAVNSGTAALHAALVALDVRGRDVVVPPFTFSATCSSVLLAGARPVFADISPETFCLDPKEVKRVITKKTAAILTVELFGYLPDLSELKSLGVPVVEDSCQAVGASRAGVFAGTSGIAGAFSFNGSKAIPTGEGGCLVTNSDKIASLARKFINHGENFGSQEVGVNYRMHELVAVLARHGLRELEERNERRRELAKIAAVRMPMVCPKDCDDKSSHGHVSCWGGQHSNELVTPHGPYKEPIVGGSHHVYYVVPMLVFKDRAKFISSCAKRGLPVQESYTTPLHHLPAFRKYQTAPLPVTEELHRKTLCLLTTLTPEKPLSYARKVAKIIREALE